MLRSRLLAAGVIAASLLSGSAFAQTITLTDSWSVGVYTPTVGSNSNKPTISASCSVVSCSTSNLGTVTPLSDPYTQTLTQGTAVTSILLVAAPNGTATAEIPITFTLSDTTGGTATFTDYINYFAQTPDTDDMQWTATAVTPGQGPCGSPSPGAWASVCTAAQLSSLQLVQTITLSDNKQIQITLPYETDWNMAQQITFKYTGTSSGGGQTGVPEPASLAVLGVGVAALAWAARRRRNHPV